MGAPNEHVSKHQAVGCTKGFHPESESDGSTPFLQDVTGSRKNGFPEDDKNTGKLFNGQFSPSHYSSKYAINGSKLRMQLDPPLRMEIHPGTHSDGTQIPQAAHTTTIPTRIPSGTGSDWEASMEMSI